jgi:hypothetical protein
MDDQPGEDPTTTDQLTYELDEWSTESRELLDRLLTSNGITHAWQGGTLAVAAADGELVDDLVGEVEATLMPLDPDAEKVVYEVAEWSAEDRADLTDALEEEGVRYVYDEMGDLVVEAADEDRVDLVVDDLTDGEESDDDDGGPPPSDLLSELFVAADKLRRNPRDSKAVGAARTQAGAVIALPPPYGFERRTWAQVGLRAGALRSALEEEPADDETVTEAATALRDLLHPMV